MGLHHSQKCTPKAEIQDRTHNTRQMRQINSPTTRFTRQQRAPLIQTTSRSNFLAGHSFVDTRWSARAYHLILSMRCRRLPKGCEKIRPIALGRQQLMGNPKAGTVGLSKEDEVFISCDHLNENVHSIFHLGQPDHSLRQGVNNILRVLDGP